MCQEREANVPRDGITVRILTPAILYTLKDAVKQCLWAQERRSGPTAKIKKKLNGSLSHTETWDLLTLKIQPS